MQFLDVPGMILFFFQELKEVIIMIILRDMLFRVI